MPTRKNESSVLVSCCGSTNANGHANGNGAVNGAVNGHNTSSDSLRTDTEGSVQTNPVTHLQGTENDVDPKDLGKKGVNGSGSGSGKRLSKIFSGWKKESK
jgi:hypothetical protein